MSCGISLRANGARSRGRLALLTAEDRGASAELQAAVTADSGPCDAYERSDSAASDG